MHAWNLYARNTPMDAWTPHVWQSPARRPMPCNHTRLMTPCKDNHPMHECDMTAAAH